MPKMMAKKPWESRTMWANVIMVIASFFPIVQDFLTPDKMIMVMGAVNAGLRMITKDRVSLS